MPDFNKYSVNTPYIRPELPKNGLSLIIQPVYDYKDTFPNISNFDFSSSEISSYDYLNKDGEKDLLKYLGQVPIAPAAATPYSISKRYDDPDLMFLPTRDNEDLYAKNQGFFSSVGKGLGRLVLTAGTKLGTGIGYLGGLMGFGNNYENYEPGFSGWIAGAADNGLKQWFENTENETIKNDWLPIYQEASDRDKGFFRRAATDLNFWTEDVSDGLAFMASAWVPGMAISKLGMGTALLRNAAFLRDLTYAREEAALASEGLSGSVESTSALAEGATTRQATQEGYSMFNTPGTSAAPGEATIIPEAGTSMVTTKEAENGLRELPRVFNWIDNAKLARSIDVGATTIINTASEAMFEADGVKKDLIDKLSKEKNPDGTYKYTPDQVRLLAAKGAKDTYLMNLGALSISNLWEANLFFKKLPSRGASLNEKFNVSGLWDDVKLQKKVFGERLWENSKDILKGVGAEGIWEENIQLAIQRLNESNENFDLDFGGKLSKLTGQYFQQTFDALSGNDPEAASNIGIGGLVGGLVGELAGRVLESKANIQKNVSNLNSQVSAFKTLGNIYETDSDGKIKLDSKGSPVIDETKLKAYTASLNKILNMQEISNNLEKRGINELSQIYTDELFARYAKAHFDNGLGDLLYKRLDDIKNISPEDMVLLGFDPSSKDNTIVSKLEEYKNRAAILENLYDNIQRNYLPFRKDKKGKKFYKITDKIFYMSARMQSLNNLSNKAKQQYEQVKTNSEAYDAAFNHETDSIIEGYNQKFEALEAAKRQTNIARQQQSYIDQLTSPISETRRGVSVQAASRLERLQKENPSVAISLPENFVEQNEEVINKRQKDLDQYLSDNKEVLERMKKDSRGRYLYEIANKNILPSSKEMERLQILQAEYALAHDSTMKSLSRLSDLVFGEKYYDKVYEPALSRQAENLRFSTSDDEDIDEVTPANDNLVPKKPSTEKVLNDDEIDTAYNQAVENGKIDNEDELVEHIANKISKGQTLSEKEESIRQVVKDEVEDELKKRKEKETFGEVIDRENELKREKNALESVENKTDEQNTRLDEIYKELDALEDNIHEKQDEFINDITTSNSKNIKEEDKDKYKQILNKISKNKRRVVKYDDHYEIDGKRYGKVTDIIGDIIPNDVREKVQNAINAGYTIDALVKAFFDQTIDDQFKNNLSDKISEEAYNSVIKQLQKIKQDLAAKGIEIVASNVYVFDEDKNVAGEIDLLGVDKNGDFKIYEIQARRQEVYKIYGLRGRGIKIRELDQQRLSAYRNMFANQYGAVPNEISVMFPFQVKYDKESAKGYIENADAKKAIRFTPSWSVEIKRKIFEPIRVGSKFDNIDLLRIFTNTFLTNDDAKAKVRFLMRNVSLDEIKKKIRLTIRNSKEEFQERFNKQQALLNGQPTDYKLTKFPGFDNMYSLSGNKEVGVYYEDTLLGYMSPSKTLAYKDGNGNYQILDENTDSKTYTEVTGNSEQTYPEFKRIAQSYKFAYGKLEDALNESGENEVTFTNDKVQDLYEPSLSYGEFDKVPTGEERPLLSELTFSGTLVGKKQVPTVIHIDTNDSVMVMMEKGKRTKNTINKYQNIDKWANNNIDSILSAITNKDGRRVTEYVGIIELPTGEYKIISLKKNANSKLQNNEEFVNNLGDNFTSAVKKNVFKNESIMMLPKFKEEIVSFDLKDTEIAKKVYPAEEIESLEKFGLSPSDAQQKKYSEIGESFFKSLSSDQQSKFNELYTSVDGAYDDYLNSLGFGNFQDYLDHIKECKL